MATVKYSGAGPASNRKEQKRRMSDLEQERRQNSRAYVNFREWHGSQQGKSRAEVLFENWSQLRRCIVINRVAHHWPSLATIGHHESLNVSTECHH
jgi:hypothetical protein